MVKELLTLEEFKTIKNEEEGNILIWFTASWCGPCNMITPTVLELEQKNPSVSFFKVDVDTNNETALAFDVVTLPQFIFFKEKSLFHILVGSDIKQLKTVLNHVQFDDVIDF